MADPLTPKPYADNEAQHRRLVVAQCHGTNVGPMGTLRQGNGNLTGGVPFVAFDRTQATTSGEIAGPLRACGAQAEGVNDGKADAQCVAFDWQAGHGNDTSFRGKSRSYIVRKGAYAQIRKNAHDAVHGPFGVRRLTPTECCRLQDFPDDWNATGIDDEGQVVEVSDTQRYRQMGNAVCVAEAEWLGHRILEAT